MADTVRAGTSLGLEPRTADISRAATHARNVVVGWLVVVLYLKDMTENLNVPADYIRPDLSAE